VSGSQDEGLTHTHAEASVVGRVLHIDRVSGTRFGPGRSIVEFRLFFDGVLAGRGGSVGCSLGFGGRDLPAVALVGDRLAVTVEFVEGVAIPIVELWKVRPLSKVTSGC
jgi:hypothetical protein